MLLVEDSKITALGIKRILKEHAADVFIEVAENGQIALDMLSNIKNDDDLPKFILLDLNMPVMNGIEFLSLIKKDNRLRRIPIIIHTTSSNIEDYTKCKTFGISGYFIKNVNYKIYKKNINTIVEYWCSSFNG
jgi:CheY-like chemotaxis protein